MSLKSILRDLKEVRDGLGGISKRSWSKSSHIAPDQTTPPLDNIPQSPWASLPPELLHDIIWRVEESETAWPARAAVVSCASVCKSWRGITMEIVRIPEQCGKLTFPISLKQPGPRDSPIQCFIKRNRATATYILYYGLMPSETENDKLLLAARRIRRATCTDFIISLSAKNFSRSSSTYVGKLRSGFLGTKFTIYDNQTASSTAQAQPNRRLHPKQAAPKLPTNSSTVGNITYELNVLRTRGPRRMHCAMDSIPLSSVIAEPSVVQGIEEEVSSSPSPKGETITTDKEIPDIPLSLDPTRPVVHSSLYRSLRTNIPRECMGFTDFPFATRPHDGSRDPRRHPAHTEVLAYLRDFAKEFDIEEMVRFETEVVKAEQVAAEGEERGKWRVESRSSDGVVDEIYDAVVVCNGHYTEPRHALITGIDSWPGKQIHSHNYRVPDQFKDQVVIVIGSSASGVDICRDIAQVAKEVHVSSRSTSPDTYEKLTGYENLWLHSTIQIAREDGSVVFENGKTIYADTIMHCTGYKYYFPFLDTKGEVTVDDNRVGPLYKHVFPPALAPSLSFIGLPWQITPFPMFELQSKWVAAVLSGRVSLPSQDEMMEDTKAFYDKLEASGIPKRYTHLMPDDSQFEYDNWLADQCEYPRIEKWREQMFYIGFKRIYAQSSTYRDNWDDDHLIVEAYDDFVKFMSSYQELLPMLKT